MTEEFDPRICEHKNREVKNWPYANNGNPRYCRQCVLCGKRVGDWISKSEALRLLPLDTIPLFDFTLRRRMEKLSTDLYESDRKMRQAKERAEWQNRYASYRRTDQWRTIREAVLKRANGICEGCGASPPVVAHHLSYDHMGHEFLWELAAVCQECHDRVHADEAANSEESEEVQYE